MGLATKHPSYRLTYPIKLLKHAFILEADNPYRTSLNELKPGFVILPKRLLN